MKKQKSVFDNDDVWAELISNIEIRKVPVEYLSEIIIEFDNNKVWSVDLHPNLTVEQYQRLEYNLSTIFKLYEGSIINVKHKIDIKKLRKDITSKTKPLFKKLQK